MSKNTCRKVRAPEVKMTKTARMRLLKANPLIKYQIQKTNNMEMAENLDLDNVSLITKAIVDKADTSTFKLSKESKVKQPQKLESKKIYQFTKPKHGSLQHKVAKIESNKKQNETGNRKELRRSISAPRLKESIDIMDTISEGNINRSLSVENITTNIKRTTKTLSDKRDSLSHIHLTPSAPVDLRRRLSDWLEKRNRKYSSFKHLKCFGVHKINIIEEENKENVNTSSIKREGSYEELKIDKPIYDKELEETTLIFAPSDLQKVAKEAMKDLYCLISEGYPKEQCEAWLKVIRNKCPQVVEDSQYWECRAKIEQLRGNFGSAVECYKIAVVQGAEETSVKQSLDQLLQKFRLLDIDSTEGKEPQKERVKVVEDFKNVFTSMIIKFAIQEKSIKDSKINKVSDHIDPSESKVSSRILVTPVRRSTRLSRSLYTSTPGTKICSSIQELDCEEKKNMIFQPNTALLDI